MFKMHRYANIHHLKSGATKNFESGGTPEKVFKGDYHLSNDSAFLLSESRVPSEEFGGW